VKRKSTGAGKGRKRLVIPRKHEKSSWMSKLIKWKLFAQWDGANEGQAYHDCQLPILSIFAERREINFSASMVSAWELWDWKEREKNGGKDEKK
jgi:hypothetical protein